MDKCLYNGEVLYACQVLENFAFEQQIRHCGTLTCCECGTSVFFRHGKDRIENFAHRDKGECQYGRYCSKQSKIFRHTQMQLASHIKKIVERHGFQFDEDVVIIQEHYTAFVLRGQSVSFAIDIVDYAATASQLEKKKMLYEAEGYQYLQITVDKNVETTPFSERNRAYFPVKFALNNSANHTAVVIDSATQAWSIYVYDNRDLSRGLDDTNQEWLINDALPLSISPDELDIDNDGFYTLRSRQSFQTFCVDRTKKKQFCLEKEKKRREYMERERKRKAEQEKRRQEEYAREQQQKEELEKRYQEEYELAKQKREAEVAATRQKAKEELRKMQERSKRRAEKEQQKQARRAEILESVNKSNANYAPQTNWMNTVRQLIANRPDQNQQPEYAHEDFVEFIKGIKAMQPSAVTRLFEKMCFISQTEQEILMGLYIQLIMNDTDLASVIDCMMTRAGIKH